MQKQGFTLLEVLIAMAVLSAATLGGVHLMAFATRGMHVARMQGTAALAAASRLDQLRSLRFEFGPEGQRVTDLSTDLTVDPPTQGGRGLAASGPGSLDANVSGFVDYLDAAGRWVGNGASVPSGAVFVRRWAVEAPASPDLLVLQVLVRPVANAPVGGQRQPGDARLFTARARVRR
jgi:prepilin-type N-terminal cleavage/methylation domain-containing protein